MFYNPVPGLSSSSVSVGGGGYKERVKEAEWKEILCTHV
jgi:hypothetical protein